ncbi:distal tail protein Dit [Paenibacillus paeoniae]|uniref:Phage tail protein n=1 Tax=Paenibacillus paeoniae TaxID=2292705 RepID=A0A371PJI7_9BACL|nr:distal tail protein Dit [Paenibacillus paeoniae]REK76303.1 phage tail protein [Paenibacillus paeoniae]
MTIHDSAYFTFNSIRSKDLSMLNVSLDGNMQEEYLAASQSILEDKIRGRHKPYFQGIAKKPLELTVHFAFENGWDAEELRSIRRWLTEPAYYVPLTFSNDPEKIYYVLYSDDPHLLHNSAAQGYVTLRFRCNDSYAYSPLMTSQVYDWTEQMHTINHNEFHAGDRLGTTLDSSGQLTLTPNVFKWSDLPVNGVWSDIFK